MKVCNPANIVSTVKQHLGLAVPTIKACRTPGNLRSMVIAKHFGNSVDETIGNFRYELYCLAPMIEGVHFEYMELSNGGFYLSCLDEQFAKGGLPRQVPVTWRLGIPQQGELSFDAASIVAMLLTYVELGGIREDDRFRRHFDLLLDYAKCHVESDEIQRLTHHL